MSKCFFFIFLFNYAFATLNAHDILEPQFAQIKQAQIDYYEAKIAKELRRGRYVQIGLAATLMGTIGFCGYRVLLGAAPQQPATEPATVLTTNQKVSKAALKEALDKMQELVKNQKLALINAGVLNDSTTWGNWFKSWARFFGQQYTFIFLSQIATDTLNPFAKYFKRLDAAVDSVIAKVFHDGDLNWFVRTHTNIFALLDQLKSNYYDENPLSFSGTWQLTVQQLSSIVGFMHYKIKELEKLSAENAQRAHLIVDKVIILTNHMRNQLEALVQMQKDITMFSRQVELINQLHNQLQQTLSEFALIEAVTIY
jgi:hypothetical protein